METLKIKQIVPDANQPRKFFDVERLSSLRESIKKHGIVNPIIVKPTGDNFTIIDGERRFRAATQLGLKEVPVVIREVKDEVTEMIEQFHVQEQHEDWTPAEKAQVLSDLADKMKLPLVAICEKLNIQPAVAKNYIAFSKLSDRTRFQNENVNISYAQAINSVKLFAKNIKESVIKEGFTPTDARKLEKNLVTMIHDGEITNPGDFAKIKDIMKVQPKSVEQFIDNPQSISEMFVKSKAMSAHHLRNIVNGCRLTGIHIASYLAHPDTKPTKKDMQQIKYSFNSIKKLLDIVGDIE